MWPSRLQTLHSRGAICFSKLSKPDWKCSLLYCRYSVIIVIYLPMEHQRAVGARFKGDRAFQVELELRRLNVGFWVGRKTGEPGEKPSEQRREPTINSTHIYHRVRETNPGHIGGRRAPLTTAPSLLSNFIIRISHLVVPWEHTGKVRGEILGMSLHSTDHVTTTQTDSNRPFPSCCEPRYESEARCTAFHMKISFVSTWMKTNFHTKSCAPSLAFITRFTATRKWPIASTRRKIQHPYENLICRIISPLINATWKNF